MAVKWFRKAAEQGYANVVYYLSDSLLKELYPALDLAVDTSLLRRLNFSLIHLNGRKLSGESSLADAR